VSDNRRKQTTGSPAHGNSSQEAPVYKEEDSALADFLPAATMLDVFEQLGVDTTDPKAVATAQLVMAQTTSMSSSPYPSPAMLRDYDEHYRKDFSERIIDRIDAQTIHRQCLERLRVDRSERRKDRAQWNALIISVGGLGIAGAIALTGGSAWIASIIAIVAVGGPNTATVLARWLDRGRDTAR